MRQTISHFFFASMIKVSTDVSRSSPGETFISFSNRKGHITNRTLSAKVKRTMYIFIGTMPLNLLKILNLFILICSHQFHSNHFQVHLCKIPTYVITINYYNHQYNIRINRWFLWSTNIFYVLFKMFGSVFKMLIHTRIHVFLCHVSTITIKTYFNRTVASSTFV